MFSKFKICVKILSEPGEVPHSKYFAGRYLIQMECDNIGGANRNPKFPTPKICVKILNETGEVLQYKYFADEMRQNWRGKSETKKYLTAKILRERYDSETARIGVS